MKKNIFSGFAKPLVGLVAFTLVASTIFGINFFASLGKASAVTPTTTVTLRPNEPGSPPTELLIWGAFPPNWQAAGDQNDSTVVYTTDTGWRKDLYGVENTTLSGSINKVTVYIKAGSPNNPVGRAKIEIKTGSKNDSSPEIATTTIGWVTSSQTWTTNPSTNLAWTWDEINALQVGVSLKSGGKIGLGPVGNQIMGCTDVWVVVDYASDFTAPTSAITSPSDNAYVKGNTTISATANDTGSGVAKVEFWHSSPAPVVKIGEDTTAPYSINWDTTSVADGPHSLWVDAYDNANNHAVSALVSVTVDNTTPVLHLPTDITMEATSPSGAVITYEATADDMAPANPTVVCAPASGSTFVLGDTTVNCSATDTAGNIANGSFKATVQDTTAPIITAPADQTFEATGPLTDPAGLVKATATDIADANPVITYEPTSFPVGTTLVTWTATDGSNNSITTTSNVTITDTTGPEINLNGNNPYDIFDGDNYSTLNPDPDYSAIDLVDGDITGTKKVTVTGKDFENTLGAHTITYVAVDSNNNSTTVTRTVNVVNRDKPLIHMLGNVTLTIEGALTYLDAGATAMDRDGSDITSLIVTINSVISNIVGTYSVTYDVTGAELGTYTGTNIADQKIRTVNVVDTTAPTITINGDNPTHLEVGETYNELGAIASDIVDGNLTPSIMTAGTVDTLTVGTYTITYDVTDAASNSATQAIRTVIVSPADTTNPTIISAKTTGTSTIEILFDEELQNDPNGHHPSASDFDVYNDLNGSLSFDEGDFIYGITDVSYANQKVTITLANAIEPSHNPRLFVRPISPTPATLIDLADNLFNNGEAFDMAIENNIAPIISGETAVPGTDGVSIVINWTTDHPATSRVVYDTISHPELNYQDLNYGYAFSTVEADVSPMVTNHSVTISGLNPATNYYFRSVSHGSPESVSQTEYSVTTNNLPTPPPPVVQQGNTYGGGSSLVVNTQTTTTENTGELVINETNLTGGETQTTGGGAGVTGGTTETGEQGAIGEATTTEETQSLTANLPPVNTNSQPSLLANILSIIGEKVSLWVWIVLLAILIALWIIYRRNRRRRQ
ncbi:MAG: immunoglobulin-like domain-containing protein [Candidatus Paceibacterota bacterium]|jgi:hypothetical protein